eukprot:TRINITY_DN347_c0_g1_i1.p1 TRINITY_DN347_c0_g1~~TRINITY_DN347_c0_g1_i1.p1  ORF type:complete len:214 (+),score=68.30 TRINITY_DN347_c0_g1_i1:14-655(+)
MNRAQGQEAVENQMEVAAIDASDSSTQCNVTGECVACTEEEKATDSSCKGTGYRQMISCIERYNSQEAMGGNQQQQGIEGKRRGGGGGEGNWVGAMAGEGVNDVGERGRRLMFKGVGHEGFNEKNEPWRREAREVRGGGFGDVGGGKAGVKKFSTFQSCKPEDGEVLSVLGFEGIMFGLLALCAPIVYHRKRRSYQQLSGGGGSSSKASANRF